jgi:translation elongation factor EF-1alpha
MLAKALGVSGFIVVVTKMGTNNWDEKRFNLIKEQVTPFL